MKGIIGHITPLSARRILLAVICVFMPSLTMAESGAVEYWGGARSLADMAAFVQAFYNITVELTNVIATLISFYSCAQIYIKINAGEEGFTKNVSMLIGAIVYYIVILMVFPAFFAGSAGGHGGIFSFLFG